MIALDHLKTYNDMGWALFPCSAKNKKPITAHGFKDASLDWQQIEEWYQENPGCAWATPTSAERGVLDIDPRHNGHLHLAELESKYGTLPPTWRVKTGGGGWHYWLRFPHGTKGSSPYPGIDIKADGGYVIIPPSMIVDPLHEGRAYAWEVRPWETPIAEAPAWSLKPSVIAVKQQIEADPWIVQEASEYDLLSHPGAAEGSRRITYVKLAGIHISRGDSEASIRAMSEAWAARCSPPFDEWEKHLRGLLAKDEAKRMTTSTSLMYNPPCAQEGSKEVSKCLEAEAELLASLPSADNKHEVERLSFPSLQPEAYHGLFGEMLKAVNPHTEADPAGVLLGWLTCFGAIVGRGAWLQVGPRKHHPALYVGIVGKSSDAKGDCWASSLWPFREVESAWASACIAHGVGSGEGLIERVADAEMGIDEKGKAQVIQAGALDKRCLLRLSELSQCFKRGRRENATLSEHLREAWDGEPIHVPNRKGNGNALSASEYAVSMVGDITPEVLRKTLTTGTEAFDGWANRFLWCAVRSGSDLPDGGSMEVLKPYLVRLKSALTFAKTAGELRRDAEADALWREAYPSLKRSGDSVPHTDRARPYAVRLSMLYALADQSHTIKVEHLRSALAVWGYCRESARLLFGGQQEPKPEAVADPLWLQVLNAIQKEPGIKKEALTIAFKNRMKAPELDENLLYLEAKGVAYRMMLSAEGKGRPAECWFPGKPDGDGLGKVNDNPTLSPLSRNASKEVSNSDMPSAELLTSLLPSSSQWVVQADEEEVGCPFKSQVEIADISPPPGSPLEAEADEALDAEAFLDRLATNKLACLHEYRTAGGVCVKCSDGLKEWREAKARREAERHQQWLVSYAEAQAKREARERQQEEEDTAFDPDFLSCPPNG